MEQLRPITSTGVVFLRREALDLGIDDKSIRRALRNGEIVRVRQGAYVFTDHWVTADAEQRHLIRSAAVVRQARCEPVLSHFSAALVFGADLWDIPLDEVHITRPDRKGGRKEAGIVQHRGRLRPADVVSERNWKCTSPVRTALDITTVTGVERATVVVSSMLHEKRMTQQELLSAADSMKHVPHSLTTDLVLHLADPRFESVGESRTAYAMWSQGLPQPVPQLEVYDEAGTLVASLDFAWPERRVWVEFDGKKKYEKLLREGESASDVVVREKTREDEVRRLTGWICVRLTWDDLARPWEIASKIRAAFAQQQRPAV